MDQLVIKTLKSKYLLIPVFIASIIFIGIIIYFDSIKDLIIFPNNAYYKFDYYTDKPNGGNSKVLEYAVSDSAIKLKFLLRDKFHSPYVGFSITPVKKKSINAAIYNQISISLSSQNMERIDVSLYTPPLNFAENDNQDQTLHHSYLNITSQPKTYHIPVSQFQFPDWWEDLHQIPENKKDNPDLKNLLHINIGSAFSPHINMEKTLVIYSITFSRNNHTLFLIIILIFVTLVLLNYGILYARAARKAKASNITVSYRPLEMKESVSVDDKCIDYISRHYQDSNLTLEIIAKETATTPRRITQVIHDNFNCNFKTYLNRIRINESKRFLTESDLHIGEIAYNVGFNNQSHFNRVFRSELNISPTEYREKNKL